jgi:hypothetical protein
MGLRLEQPQASHYHAYELSPTPGELRAWRDEVIALLRALPSPSQP